MKRTDAQKQAFVRECLEIEKANGDVLGYIEVHWPSYTPRATWYNLQREYTSRKSYQMTEGKPKERKDTNMANKQEETALALIECVNKPDDIRSCLTRLGYTNVTAALLNAKRWARKHRPDLAETLEKITLRKPSTRATEKKSGGEWQAKVGEMVIIGSSYENEMVTPSPTCCQPARPSGVTVPDELPDILPVCAVKSNVAGKWELARNDGFVHLIYQETQCLTLHADKWLELAREIPKMLAQLGL